MVGAKTFHTTLRRAVFLAAFMAIGPAFAQSRVNAIVVEGNQRIPDSTVASLTELQPGQVATTGQLNDALQNVRRSGLFEDVTLSQSGNTLIITVVERPTINRISIEGNRRLDDDVLLAVIDSQSRRVFSPSVAEADASAIADAYADASRLAASVTPRIIRRQDNRVDLVFEISEGRVVENERVSFVGNRAFSDRRLRRVVATKQAGLLRRLIQADTFIADRIAFDRRLLTDFYASRGYVDFQVLDVTSELSRERDATFVTFNVREGQTYDVGRVTVSSAVPGVNLDDYRDALSLRSGETWSPTKIDLQIARLERLAINQGFDFVRVDPQTDQNARTRRIDVDFRLVRGPRVFVERIDIEGNQTTLDRVIRQQFDTVEGDPFNPREIRRAADRIRALDFFAESEVNTREGSNPTQVVVDVDVEEKPTGSLSLGGGYSDDTGFALAVGFSERNFLGRGQALTFNIQSGTENRNAVFSFTEPAFLGRDVALGIALRYATTDFDDAAYETTVATISPSLAFPTSENGRLRLYYEIGKEEIDNVTSDASVLIQNEEGEIWKSAIGYSYTLDLLRGGLDPTRGVRFTFGQEIAGLGGDAQYLRSDVQVVAERPVWNDEVTLRAIFEGGSINSFGDYSTRVTDRYFLSSSQLRGFSSRTIGPRDLATAGDDVLGGNQYAVARFEADFPLGLPEEYGLSGGIFFDAGSVWGLDDDLGGTIDDGFELRTAAGVSLFWETPIGPLRLNFSRPISKTEQDDENRFDIAISTNF